MCRSRFTGNDLIEALHKLAKRAARTPIEYDTYDYPDIPSHTMFVKRFSTRREALLAANIPLNPPHMGYDRAALLEHLLGVAEALGKVSRQGPRLWD